MESVSIKLKWLAKTGHLPQSMSAFAAGWDVYASPNEQYPIRVGPGERCLIKTGFAVQIPRDYEIQVRPRSGLALKKGISVLNTPGTIDADYRGEVGVILINHGQDDLLVDADTRIAQLVIKKVYPVQWDVVSDLQDTQRGEGGFGHSG